jgi:membrane protease YdiL (CAAX protease family)
LAWHHLAHQPWRLSGGVLSGMAAESLLLGACLCLVCLAWGAWNVPPAADIGAKIRQSVGSIVALLGAGIYEELLFRLILLSLLVWGLRKAGIAPGASTLLAVIVSSLLFAAAHHVGPYGEPWVWSNFAFRTLAGGFFSAVFLCRGFGIAAGSHAAYDVLVVVERGLWS